MMVRTKRSRRSYGAGEWGRNRVRVFPDPKTGLIQIEWRENGRRLTRSLKTPRLECGRNGRRTSSPPDSPTWSRTARQDAEPEPLTLERLFDIYT